MKNLKLIIALLISTAIMFSCKDKDNKPTPPDKPNVEKKVDLTEILTATEIQSLTASIGANATMRGKPVKLPKQVTVAAATMTLTNNGGGSFSIDYGGATNALSHFFRGSDSLSTVSGNVYPRATLQYSASITTWTATFSTTYYQSLVVTGSLERDANGVLGADWVFTYTNVVQ